MRYRACIGFLGLLLLIGSGGCFQTNTGPEDGALDLSTLPGPTSTADLIAPGGDSHTPADDTISAPQSDAQTQPESDGQTTEGDLQTADGADPIITPGPPAEVMKRRVVKDAQARLAICNKGDDFAYYVRRGTGTGSNKWIVFLKGGGSCMNAAECRHRGKVFTMAPTEPTRKPGGIFETDQSRNPRFYNWNQIYLYYCSSDVWIGDREASEETGNLHFRGARIITAVFEDLMDPTVTPAPTLAVATHLILAGGSAGAHGVANNLNRVIAMVPSTIDVAGIVDSGLSKPTLPFGQDEPNPNPTPPTNADFWNAPVDSVCLADLGDRNRCLGPYALRKYFQTRAFFYVDQADPKALEHENITNIHDPAQREYVINVYAPAQRQLLAQQPAGCFSTFTYTHTALISNKFYSLKVDGLTYREVLSNWYFDTGGPTKVIAQEPEPF